MELQARVQSGARGGAPAAASVRHLLEIVYEDNHLAVVVKPPGMATQVCSSPAKHCTSVAAAVQLTLSS